MTNSILQKSNIVGYVPRTAFGTTMVRGTHPTKPSLFFYANWIPRPSLPFLKQLLTRYKYAPKNHAYNRIPFRNRHPGTARHPAAGASRRHHTALFFQERTHRLQRTRIGRRDRFRRVAPPLAAGTRLRRECDTAPYGTRPSAQIRRLQPARTRTGIETRRERVAHHGEGREDRGSAVTRASRIARMAGGKDARFLF